MEDATRATQKAFLSKVFGNTPGLLWEAKRPAFGGMPFNYPSQIEEALDFLNRNSPYTDTYLCAQLVDIGAKRDKQGISVATALSADLDYCHPSELLVQPTYAVESSPGRYHAWWVLERPVSASAAEEVQRRIAYFHKGSGADTSGWDISQYLRLPGTLNHRHGEPAEVRIISEGPSNYRLSDFDKYPEVEKPKAEKPDSQLPEPEPMPEWPNWFTMMLDEDSTKTEDLRHEDKGYRRGELISKLPKRGLELGHTVGEIRTMLASYPPFTSKVENQGEPWGVAEEYRVITDALTKHPHEGKTCKAAQCQHISKPRGINLPQKATGFVRRKASEYKIRPVHWCWEDRIPVGEITLEVGREGAGKSIFTAWLVSELTNGKLPGIHFGQKRLVWYVASEDSWEATIVPRLMAAGADLDLIEHIAVSTDDGDETKITVPRDCALIGDEALRAGAVMIVFDPLLSVIDGEISTNQTRELRDALEPLRKHAEKARMSVLALMHFNKMQTGDVLTKIAGARGFAEVARAALAIAVDQEADEYTAVLSQAKNNLGRTDLPNLAYTIEGFEIQTDEGIAKPGVLRWTSDEYESSAETILNRDAKEKSKKQTAKDWLYTYLANATHGKPPVEKDDVLVQASEVGYKPATINNAMTTLKKNEYAQSEERGFGADKKTYWGLRSAVWFTITRKGIE